MVARREASGDTGSIPVSCTRGSERGGSDTGKYAKREEGLRCSLYTAGFLLYGPLAQLVRAPGS